MMDKIGRFVLFIFILGIILFLGLIFSAWVVPNIVQPIAGAIWLFARVFILSVDQVYYWNLLSIVVVIWVIFRLARRKSSVRSEGGTVMHEAISNLKSWQEALILSKHDGSERNIARSKLLQLLISYYASRQQSPNQLEIRQDLEQRRLSLPDSVYNFLFLSESQKPSKPSKRAFYNAVSRWYCRISGQEEAVFDRMIDELIDFIKT
jgi:hypothetical protein